MKGIDELQKNWKSFLAANAKVASPSEPLKLSDDEWRKRLPPEVLQGAAQGRHGAGRHERLNDEKRAACSSAPAATCRCSLRDEFESGTGWPSFFTTIPARSR